MKNKKMVTIMTACGLLAATSVGASLAYLTDNTGELENKFTFADGIDMVLDEDKVDAETHKVVEEDAIVAGNTPTGNTYNNILPGEVLPKDPTVTINAGSPDAYVFVSVENPSEELTLNINSDWKEVEKSGNSTIYVYVDKAGNPKVVEKSDANTRLTPVFTTVTVANISEGDRVDLDNIVVKASAVQSKVNGEDNYDAVKEEGLSLLRKAA